MNKFRKRKGAEFGQAKAQIYGKRLCELAKKHKKVTPEIIVADAKSKTSPLHDYFEWDNTAAANKWRRHQARMLCVKILIEIPESDTPVRMLFNVSDVTAGGRVENKYVLREEVEIRSDYQKQLIDEALLHIKTWGENYNDVLSIAKAKGEYKNLVNKINRVPARRGKARPGVA